MLFKKCVLPLSLLLAGKVLLAQTPNYKRGADGVILYVKPERSGNAKAVRLQVVSDKIIRVSARPGGSFEEGSLVVTGGPGAKSGWTLTEGRGELVLKTAALVARVQLATGSIRFYDRKGVVLLKEKASGGRRLEPTVEEGEPLYGITQVFQTAPGEGLYGLGQHQDNLFNYKGYQVSLFQNNTEVAVPFLISTRNYGILWDNYSLTKAGDLRSYRPLSALRLYSKDGERGWLTASYANNKDSASKVHLTRAESSINYEYLNDSKLHLPADFRPEKGVVTWEGSLESGLGGVHKFRFTYGGYVKVWIGNRLLLERWRQAWNPGSAILDVPLKAGERVPVRIEWIPNGGESYLSAKWMEPLPPGSEDDFGFASEAGRQLDYYFIHGQNMDSVIAGYRRLTGRATLLPKWAFGFWQSRERYRTQEELLDVVAQFRKRGIPLDNIVQDWSYWREAEWGSQDFDPQRFPNPDSVIALVHNRYKAKYMISVWPKFYIGLPAYQQFDKKGWLYRRNVADRQRDWIGQGYVSTFYDAFNKEAQKGFWDLIHQKLYTKGVDAWWMDASEPDILSNVSPQKRKEQMTPTALGPAALYLNAYPLENARGIYEGQRSVDRDKRVFILTRSAFAGMQRYAAATWSGDIASRWTDMRDQISAGINFSMSGLPYWTMDIGGFAVESRYEKPDPKDLDEWRELNTRWYQFGAFVPLFRSHGQYPYREIYNIAPEGHPAYASMLYYNRLRYRLMPYLYTLAGMGYHQDYTLMRGLVMDFGGDTAVRAIGDQYMLGPSLLVNPVYEYGKKSREVYLPRGQGWYDLYTGKYFSGGQRISAAAPYERVPLFVREGSILPFGPEMEYTSQKKADTVALYIYGGKDASFTLYEDEDTTYGYERGAFSRIPIRYREDKKELIIGSRGGTFPGMLRQRTFTITWVDPETPVALRFDRQPHAVIQYSGREVRLSKK